MVICPRKTVIHIFLDIPRKQFFIWSVLYLYAQFLRVYMANVFTQKDHRDEEKTLKRFLRMEAGVYRIIHGDNS